MLIQHDVVSHFNHLNFHFEPNYIQIFPDLHSLDVQNTDFSNALKEKHIFDLVTAVPVATSPPPPPRWPPQPPIVQAPKLSRTRLSSEPLNGVVVTLGVEVGKERTGDITWYNNKRVGVQVINKNNLQSELQSDDSEDGFLIQKIGIWRHMKCFPGIGKVLLDGSNQSSMA